jgi:hypothetical protein
VLDLGGRPPRLGRADSRASSKETRRPSPTNPGPASRLLTGPTSPGFQAVGWIVASTIFGASLVLWYGLVHGPTGPISPTGDVWESATPAIAIEHGTLNCAYPARASSSVPPLYPLIAAGILAATRSHPAIGPWVSNTPCPGRESQGTRFPEWSFLLTGLVAWPALLVGYMALLRTGGYGGTRLELVGAWVIAASPMLAGSYVQYFHPEDVLAIGLALAATAMTLRRRWVVAGACLGLACCSKQYAVLAAIPLLVAAPRTARVQMAVAATGIAGGLFVVLTPFMGQGLLSSSFGSYATISNGPSLVGWLGLHGALRTTVARGLPLVAAGGLAVLLRRRLGQTLLRPTPLLGLVTASLVFRLLFEVNLYSYYFAPVGICLVALEVVRGRIRPVVVAWLVTTAAFYPPAFDVLVPLRERAPQLVQALVVLGALALSLHPVLLGEPTIDSGTSWPSGPASAKPRLCAGSGPS